jgi:hypothetical protein
VRCILVFLSLCCTPAAVTAQHSDAAAVRLDSATVSWDARGITVRFPRFLSPDSITSETRVGDAFSGYEWRVILVGEPRAYLAALVIPPTDSLTIHKVSTIDEAYRLGDLRSCDRTTSNLVLRCNRLAQGLVRDVEGRLEIGIVDGRWLQTALTAREPKVRLIVKVAKETIWEEEHPIRYVVGAKPE